MPASGDFGATLKTLETVTASDRSTALHAAIALAEGVLSSTPQTERQLIVLSDFSTDDALKLPGPASAPLEPLRRPFANCGLISAILHAEHVETQVACTGPQASTARQVELLDADDSLVGSAPLTEMTSIALHSAARSKRYHVRLTRSASTFDELPEDDEADVQMVDASLRVGLRADVERSGLPTGGSTVVRAALGALNPDLHLDAINVLPDSAQELHLFGALVVDDPAGFTPENAEALESYVKDGGVLCVLLGPQVANAALGSDFRPLTTGGPLWSDSPVSGVDASQEQALGALATSWHDLAPKGRVTLPASPGDVVLARFADGQPLVIERRLGRGLLLTSLLPSSVDISDLGLRPAFLALFEHVLREANARQGSDATPAGQSWEIGPDTEVTGPAGPLEVESQAGRRAVNPAVAGRYALVSRGKTTFRYAVRDAGESTAQPRLPVFAGNARPVSTASQRVDMSREAALFALLLFVLELALRRKRRPGAPRLWRIRPQFR
jgi:hypothetical protein